MENHAKYMFLFILQTYLFKYYLLRSIRDMVVLTFIIIISDRHIGLLYIHRPT